MTLPMKRVHWLAGPAAIALAAFTSLAAAQPSPEQQSAIRSSCRSDFMSKCAGVERGRKEALQCLQKNVGSLSPACKTAVSATIPPPVQAAPAKPVAAPAAPPPAAAAPPPPAPAQPAPPAKTTSAPPAAAPTVNQAAPKPPRFQKPTAATPAAVAPPAPPAAPAPPVLSRQEEDALIRQSCKGDFLRQCFGVPIGEGRAIACLNAHEPSLTPACRAALRVASPR